MPNAVKVGIFIDGPNLYGGARRLTGNGQLDIPALVRTLADGREIAEVAYWNAQLRQSVNPTSYAGQQRFFAHIENNLPNARIGRANLKQRDGRWIEKGVDVGLALDLITDAFDDRWDVAIAVTGDGDRAGAGRLVREIGKSFEVVCCAGSLSDLLEAQADRITILDAATLRGFQHA